MHFLVSFCVKKEDWKWIWYFTLEITQGKQIVSLMDLLMSFHAKKNITLDTAQSLSFPGLISIISSTFEAFSTFSWFTCKS